MTRRDPLASIFARRPSLRALNPAAVERETTRTTRHPAHPQGLLVWLGGLLLASEANAREVWQARADRTRRQREATGAALAGIHAPRLPCRVVVTRCAPRALDTDNLTGSAKHVRDAVAQWLGVDDASPRIEWIVRQEPPGPDGAGVRVEVVPRPEHPRATVDLAARTTVRVRLTEGERLALVEALQGLHRAPRTLALDGLDLHLTPAEDP